MLGALLKQVVGGLDKIPEEIMKEFVEQRKVLGARVRDLTKLSRCWLLSHL